MHPNIAIQSRLAPTPAAELVAHHIIDRDDVDLVVRRVFKRLPPFVVHDCLYRGYNKSSGLCLPFPSSPPILDGNPPFLGLRLDKPEQKAGSDPLQDTSKYSGVFPVARVYGGSIHKLPARVGLPPLGKRWLLLPDIQPLEHACS